MTHYDYLILGGGIAGVTAAETIRENDASATIGIFSEEEYLPYSRVLLPTYLKRRIPREKLFLRSADSFTEKKIDIQLGIRVVSVDASRREVVFSGGGGVTFSKLLIATGGRVLPWGEAHIQDLLYRLQTIDDADRLFSALAVGAFQNPLVVGASFISLEFLEIFLLNKITPSLLVRDSHFFSRIFDRHGGELLEENFSRHGIPVHFNEEIEAVEKKEGTPLKVHTKGLREFECDAITAGVGIIRNKDFLENSGIECGTGGVLTNEYLETNVEGIFAAGDIAEFFDVVFGTHRVVGNWTNAFLQGKHAGLVMTRTRLPFRNVSGYSITNLGLQITALGESGDYTENIVRRDTKKMRYERILLKNDIIVGAALINWFEDRVHLAKLIERRISIEPYREKLNDPLFDIRTIEV